MLIIVMLIMAQHARHAGKLSRCAATEAFLAAVLIRARLSPAAVMQQQ